MEIFGEIFRAGYAQSEMNANEYVPTIEEAEAYKAALAYAWLFADQFRGEWVQDVLKTALHPDPSQRFRSILHLEMALEHALLVDDATNPIDY